MALVSGYMDLVNYGYLELSRCHMGHPMLPLDFFSNPSFVFTIPSLIGVHKVDMFNSATNLNWTIVFEWYVVKVRLWERIPKKMCLKEIGLCTQIIITYLGSVVNTIEAIYDHSMSIRIFALMIIRYSYELRNWLGPCLVPRRFGFAHYLVLT